MHPVDLLAFSSMALPRPASPVMASLLDLCVSSACRDKTSVKAWRQKRRTMEMLPSELAHQLFHALLRAHLLVAPLVELFQQSIQEVDVSGESSVDGEWMAYLGGCRHLRALCATDCKALTNNAIWQLTGLAAMEELNLARCRRISDEAVFHITSWKGLRKLGLAETSVGPRGLSLLSALTTLVSLDLGGCPVTDANLLSFQALKLLEQLDLWGSKVTNIGAQCLSSFKLLKYLNLAMTAVTVIPPMSSIVSLNVCNCAVESIFGKGITSDSPLTELFLSGADINLKDAISCYSTRNLRLLNLASSRVNDLDALSGMQKLSILDLRATGLTDGLMLKFREFGKSLRWIDLSYTKVGSEGVLAIAGHVPNVEQLSLSHTLVDDNVLTYLIHFPLLQSLNLSGSKVTGSMTIGSEEFSQISVLSGLEQLQYLKRLDMRHTGANDSCLHALKQLTQLSHLHVHSTSSSDECLQLSSSLSNLVCLGIGGAVITNDGLLNYKPPPLLQELDLSDCWLLSEDTLLNFCEAYPQIMVWNEQTVSIISAAKPNIHSKECGEDVVSGGLATSFSRDLQQAKLNLRKSPAKKDRMKVMKKPVNSNRSIGAGMHTHVLDERIKYKKQELLQLRPVDVSNLPISKLRNFESDLLKAASQSRSRS